MSNGLDENSPKAARRALPKYQMVHEDAFVWLAKRRPKSVHAVVTDPPYALVEYHPDQLAKRAKGRGGIWRLPQAYDGHIRRPMPRFTVLGERERLEIRKFHGRLSKALLRVLVPGGHVILASQTLLSHLVISAFTDAGFELRGQIARAVSTLRGGDRPKFAHEEYATLSVIPRSAWEPWLIFRKPCEGLVRDNLRKWMTGALQRPAKDAPFRDFIESAPARNSERCFADHPSLKPQAFMRQIVRAALPLGKGVIVDPFAGSGATLAAAEALGLRSIGIEINKTYFEMALLAIPKLAKLENGVPGHSGNTKGSKQT
jgi:DNA modification methylase